VVHFDPPRGGTLSCARRHDIVRFLYPEICACLEIEQVTNNKITEFFNGYGEERTSMSINMKAFNVFAIINIIRVLAGHIESGKYRTRDTEFENELDDRIRKMERYIATSKCFE
jgi:hypothetical protein